MSESQFNYLFTLKNAHLSSNSYNFWMQRNITKKFAGYVVWILICKRSKFGAKICYNSRDIEFFLGDYFFGAPCTLQEIYSQSPNMVCATAYLVKSWIMTLSILIHVYCDLIHILCGCKCEKSLPWIRFTLVSKINQATADDWKLNVIHGHQGFLAA